AQRVFDPIGTRLVTPQQLATSMEMLSQPGQEHLIVWAPISAGTAIGWIRLDYSLSALKSIERSIWYTTLLASAGVASGVSLLLFWFLRGPMRAIARARQFAMQLAQSNGEQMPMLAAPAEIEDLEGALNLASANLHQQRLQLADTIGKLSQKEMALATQNQRLDTIFQLSPDGFVSFDRDGKLEYANPAFLRMTDLERDEVSCLDEAAFSTLLKCKCLPQSTFSSVEAVALGHGGTGDAPKREIIELQGPGKRVLEVKGRVAQGNAVSKILYFRDISYETEVDRTKSDFLSHAAHELRTPMTSVYGFSEMLLASDFDEDTRKELLGIIHRQTGALIEIINELLDLSRIDARQGKDFNLEAVNLVSLLQSVIEGMALDEALWPVTFVPPAAPMHIHVDQAKTRQLLINVLGNARKYSPKGGGIEVALFAVVGETCIAVTDHGIGMSEEQIQHVGERFWRADTSGKIAGSGLGMSIVRETLVHLGGRLEIRSKLDQGTTVLIRLPTAKKPEVPPLALLQQGETSVS
ncbi:MAG: ATP-binding protein, partial [Rhodoferax sp.]|nr:ATP-binding protein [Rhodoferax sp.]